MRDWKKIFERIVVGAGEHTLRPGYVREHGHHGGFQGVLFMILWQDLQKKVTQGVVERSGT